MVLQSYFNLKMVPFLFTSYQKFMSLESAMATRKRSEPHPVWWHLWGLCSRRTNRVGLSFPDSFSLVPFFWRSKRKEQI